MTYVFANDKKTARRARVIARKLIAEADALTASSSLSVPEEDIRVFQVAYGWWRLVARSASALLTLSEAGYTIETAPLMRNIINHAHAMQWLAVNGDLAVDAVLAYSNDEMRKLIGHGERSGWAVAADLRAQLEEHTAPPPVRSDEDERRFRRLRGEIGNFHDLLDHYGLAVMYPVYSHLSGYSHTTTFTAGAYLEGLDDGTVELRREAASPGYSDVVWLPVALIQAGRVASRLIKGDPLRLILDKATKDLGLPDQLLPPRRK